MLLLRNRTRLFQDQWSAQSLDITFQLLILVQNPYPLLTFLVHALISMGSGNLMVEMHLHGVRAGHTAHTHSKAAPPVKVSIQPLRNNPERTKQGPTNSSIGRMTLPVACKYNVPNCLLLVFQYCSLSLTTWH